MLLRMPLPRASPCDACDARCCRAYAVHLTLDDVGRLADGLDVPSRTFAAPLPQRERSAVGFILEPGGPTHDLVLGQRPSSDPERGCMFLSGGRCSVYAHRPRACRRFPAARAGDRVVAREGIVCGTARWAEAMARRSWRAELERERRELAVHGVVVATWNERILDPAAGARSFADFLEHLADAHVWLARFRRALRHREQDGEPFLNRLREILRELR
jgi:Fe-S-cluster containining protein